MQNKLKFILSMLIFGSIGIFVKYIDIPSVQIVQWRTLIATATFIAYFVATKRKLDKKAIAKNAVPLLISGMSIGASWAFLFEAYKYTSVGMATIIYYTAPVMVFFLAPLIFKDKVTKPQIMSISAAVLGMILVNIMAFGNGEFSMAMVYAFASALLYAVIMIVNQFIKGMKGVESTFVQIFVAMVVISVYAISSTGEILHFGSISDMALVLVVGILHTVVAMTLYIGAMQHMSSQSISVFSYIDPASALLFASIFLKETLAWYQILGAILIFGGALLAELSAKKK